MTDNIIDFNSKAVEILRRQAPDKAAAYLRKVTTGPGVVTYDRALRHFLDCADAFPKYALMRLAKRDPALKPALARLQREEKARQRRVEDEQERMRG